jgi:glycosyltransferase involved in cell wall biosynthesis
MTPAVSVITPVHDGAATLAAAVASVQAQTRPDWEMLIVDDGSRDGSRALAEELSARDPRIRVLGFPENRGPAEARNAAIRASRGRVIAFLDADDLWYRDKLALQLAAIEAGAALVFTAYRRVDAAGRPLGEVGAPSRTSYGEALLGNPICCSTAAFDASALGRAEMPRLRRRQDYALWLELLRRGASTAGLQQVLIDYRVRPGSLSSNKVVAAAATWKVYREVAGLGRAASAYYIAHNLARGALKRL